ncbi:chemotaxis-specific protein-glutamate methyltransferase CheB [Roseomonas marmotae]|uniref:Protein-glutamate methylesterase/protein-glutamine glutaminase n=1 Tax=Roseomonas marmotae TaxID=2768161 RepID=A0ABS3K9A0_9PROT|nr:chemotaxis-specific protein-glutamate methyltransferase CheB [Roseomonas marmotae]MBO1074032.1 chemotaxis-specific protein-glutamate methyltransferase CheB [Roseomonas marmotae]QTI78818.1 chemotaxis-specific protein-glutamate methyltransferase CheB [Roseomonas marmotae]
MTIPRPQSGEARVVRVMLCDDSPTARSAMARVLEADARLQVVGRAGDGRQMLDMLAALPPEQRPEVVLLDLEMPVMDGMTVLPLLLKTQPRPAVIVASALTQRGAEAAMAAMRAGAVDYIPKPSAAGGGLRDPAFQAELLAKVKGWARMQGRPVAARPAPPMLRRAGIKLRPKAVLIGCSTGGPQALAGFVRALRVPLPVPLVVVQHMPAGFTTMLADHLARLGGPAAAEAREGEVLQPGRIYLAPGDRHLLVENVGGSLVAKLDSGPPENFCRPAVDPTLRSLVAACEGRVTAVILTGMGSDGMLGCKAVAAAGGTVLAQDEASSVVWGMPGAVARAGLAQALLPPEQLAERVTGQFDPLGGTI